MKFNDKEVDNVFLQFLVALLASVVILLVFAGVLVMLGIMMITFPIWLPLHFALKHYGRRGFIIPHDNGKFSIELTPDGFKKIR